jgi:hypothetical protein
VSLKAHRTLKEPPGQEDVCPSLRFASVTSPGSPEREWVCRVAMTLRRPQSFRRATAPA